MSDDMFNRGWISIYVHATPQPQGSKTRTKFGMRDDNAPRLKPWREAVKTAALDARQARGHGEVALSPPFDGPVRVDLVLIFVRPKGHWRTGRNAHLLRDSAPSVPITKPDIDKCQRSVFDALTDAGVWRDDSYVVDVRAVKRYAVLDETAGADITVRTLR